MRIALILEATAGGAARHVVDLASELIQRQHDVTLVYSPLRADARFEAEVAALAFAHLIRLPMRRAPGPWDLGAARALRRIFDRLGPFDVIHGHSSKAGALARLVTPKGASRVYTPHAFRTMDPDTGHFARFVYGGVESILGRLVCDAVIAVSPEEAEHARALGIPAGKVYTVINGITPAPVVQREAARAALGLKPGDIAAGFVGRLCAQKDPVRYAEAIRLAHARDLRVRGVVLGDGELKAETLAAGGEALTVHSGLNAREYLPAFDLFVMTSRYEAMPYVLLEALQAGLPIISTKVGGTSLTVEQNGNGHLVSVDASPHVIADSLLEGIDTIRRADWAARSRILAKDFTVERLVAATQGVYDRSRLEAGLRLPPIGAATTAPEAT
jgi:glycosyltransferase involved in cell wall biosynthesis